MWTPSFGKVDVVQVENAKVLSADCFGCTASGLCSPVLVARSAVTGEPIAGPVGPHFTFRYLLPPVFPPLLYFPFEHTARRRPFLDRRETGFSTITLRTLRRARGILRERLLREDREAFG
jgi:hypothetical protein